MHVSFVVGFMTGTIRQMLDTIYQQRAGGNQAIERVLNVKLVLKGVYPETYTESTQDDETTIEKVRAIAEEMGVKI